MMRAWLRRRGPAGALVVVLATLFSPTALAAPEIDNLDLRKEAGRIVVSFDLRDAVSEDVLERIHSGIPVVFRCRLQLERGRMFPVPDREYARAVQETRVAYDALTERYALERSLLSRARKQVEVPPPAVEERSADSLADVRAWLTQVREVPLSLPSDPGLVERLRVDIDCNLGRRWIWLVFPSSVRATAQIPLAEGG
jgi:hypothetical protein